MDQKAVEIENLSIQFHKSTERIDSFKEYLIKIAKRDLSYEKFWALKDVSLEIPQGQFVGIIGHTGSGKSTLIQHFNGLVRPSQGHIYFEGQDIWAEQFPLRGLRSQVGLVFQYPEHQLFETDVLTDVCFGPKNQNLTQEELGERIGVQKAQISRLEKGKSVITLPTMSRIFQALGVSTATLDLGAGGKVALW